MNKAMGTIATQTEARAEFILKRKDPYSNMLTDSFWSCDLPRLIAGSPQTTMSAVPLPKKALLEPRRIGEKTRIKRKRLPVYLAAKGDARAQRPRTDSSTIVNEENRTKEWQLNHPTPDSFFLTETKDYYDNCMKTPSKSFLFRGWQPLTISALLEHTRVSEVSVVKKGTYFQSRQHQLWKPQETITTYPSSSSSSNVHHKSWEDTTDCVSHYNCIGYSDACNNFYRKYSNMYSQFFGFPSDL